MESTDCILTNSAFLNNTANRGGGVCWIGANGNLNTSSFTHNTAVNGGGIYWGSINGKLTSSFFADNSVTVNGGGIYWGGANGNLIDSSFTNNIANGNGGAIFLNNVSSMTNCSFNNSQWLNSYARSNGVYTNNNLTINNGEGIVEIVMKGTLSGTNIVVLNNETYYYPPNTNINFNNTNFYFI